MFQQNLSDTQKIKQMTGIDVLIPDERYPGHAPINVDSENIKKIFLHGYFYLPKENRFILQIDRSKTDYTDLANYLVSGLSTEFTSIIYDSNGIKDGYFVQPFSFYSHLEDCHAGSFERAPTQVVQQLLPALPVSLIYSARYVAANNSKYPALNDPLHHDEYYTLSITNKRLV